MAQLSEVEDQHHYDATESSVTSPLLSPRADGRPPSAAVFSRRTRGTWPWIYVVLLGIGLAIVSDIGEDLFSAPKVRLYESVACYRYYVKHDPSLIDADGSVPERLCKIVPVQSKVASILGWQLFFDSVPAILLPIPYGYLADRRGRKWILVLAQTGYTLSVALILLFLGPLGLPLEFVWLSSLSFVIGGGPTTVTTMLTTMVADVVPPELRSTVFFYRFCTDLVADLIVPPIASVLMAKTAWTPLILAVGFQTLSGIMALGLPETLNWNETKPSLTEPSRRHCSEQGPELGTSWMQRIRQATKPFDFIIRNRTVAALVFTFLISKIGRQSSNVLYQYVSKRYGWTLAQAGLLLSLRAGVNIALFTIILPSIANFAFSKRSTASRDLWIGKASIIALTLGSFIVFSSNTVTLMIIGLIVTTLGAGFAPVMRSMATFLIEPPADDNTTNDVGRLYAVISVMEGIGSLVAGPGMAGAFRVGMDWGQNWLGLPFGFAGCLFATVATVVFGIRL